MKEDMKSVDPAAQVLLKVAGLKIETSFERAEKLKPCPIGQELLQMCHMGPCRRRKRR
jgi:hypothetical protein